MMDALSGSPSESVVPPSHEQVFNNGAPALLISYKVPFQTRLFCAANSFARFLRITQRTYTNPEDAEEFVPMKNGYRYIDNYRDRLCSIYTEPEMHHLDFERWRTSEVYTYYKGRGTTVGHEFLIATLHDAENREILLRLERGIQASSTHAHVVKGGNAWGGAQQGGARAESPGRWLSEISVFLSSAFNDDSGPPVDHFRFNDNHHVSLPQLVVLASTINEYLGTRRFHHNCYWFCRVVSEALKKRFSHKLLSADGGFHHWHNMPVSQNVDIDKVLDLYDKSWNKFVQKIDMIINNPNNRDTRMARQQAEEHRRRADKEKKRADEEARRRRDAESELAEVKALLAQRTGKSLTATGF
ncbi:hypothetical protein F5887DRAFT_1277510 [Amanita rubescens]|nr:hypothetical protein F5887DRAFT_1277510 [Amanita rubescens]